MQPSVHRPTQIIIDRQAIRANLAHQRQILDPTTQIFAVVKADGYHHGAVPVARLLHEQHIAGFCVATLDEALELRAAGLTEPILVLSVTPVAQTTLASKQDISLTAPSQAWLEAAAQSVTQPLKIHLALDTGMGRIGLTSVASVQQACHFLQQTPQLIAEGIFTHFATADEKNTDYLQHQMTLFDQMTAHLPIKFKYMHCANSATALWHLSYQKQLVRFGIALYGLNPSGTAITDLPYALQPALSLETEISHLKLLPAGQKISYGATYTTATDEFIATLPIGYADGWLRRLSGSSVLVAGQRCPIVGRICMDQMMIKVPQAYPVGTKVTLIGSNQGQTITVDELAEYSHTINYEIICNLSDRIPRKYVN